MLALLWTLGTLGSLGFLALPISLANPYPDPSEIAQDPAGLGSRVQVRMLSAGELARLRDDAVEVLRVQVDWDPGRGTYQLGELIREPSGTPALERKSHVEDTLGSFARAFAPCGLHFPARRRRTPPRVRR